MIKIKKVLSVVGISFLAITLAGCSSNNKSSDSNTLTKTEQQKKAFKEKYDEIKLGDISEKGNGGASITETTELLGKPKSTETTSVNGLKVKTIGWKTSGAILVVQFYNKKAITKTINNFKWGKAPNKLTLKTYNKIKENSSYTSLVKKYGQPDTLNDNIVMGKKNKVALYQTKTKSKSDNNSNRATFVFSDNKLISKTQVELDK